MIDRPGKMTVRMQILMDARTRHMLKKLSEMQRRSMNDVVRLAIERVYQAEMRRTVEATGRSGSVGRAQGAS